MFNNQLKIYLIILLSLMLNGCNYIIGIPDGMYEQPWRAFYLISLTILWLLPLLSIIVLIYASLIRNKAKFFLYKTVYFSVYIVAFMLLLSEISLTATTNIRMDLFITIPLVICQLIMVTFSFVKKNQTIR